MNNIKIIFFILLVVFLITICYNRNKSLEKFTNEDSHCWVRMLSGCDKELSEIGSNGKNENQNLRGAYWFLDDNANNEAQCD